MSQKIVKSTSLVALFTLLSRIMGFVRDIILAGIFGAGGAFDAFVVAFKLPNFLRRLFGEGAFSQAFVPVLADHRSNKTPEETKLFVDNVAGTLSFFVFMVVLVGEIVTPGLVLLFAPNFLHDPVRYQLTIHMTHIMFPYLLLIVLTAFAGAVLNTYNRFGAPAFTPVLLNVAMIATAFFWAPHAREPIYTLAWGVMLGGALQLAIQYPFLKSIRLVPSFRFNFRHHATLLVIKRMVPALFGVSVAQISVLIDNMFASFLAVGSISWLYYSDRLIYFPLGIIGVAIATVIMPNLSRNYSEKDESIFTETLDWALRTVLIIGVPAAVGLYVLAGPILSTLIHYGRFSNYDVVMTAKSLSAFAVGLPAFMLIKILASAFYARQNIKTPVKIAAIAVLCSVIFNFMLVFPMKHAGLALSTSLSSIVNAGLLWFFLFKAGIFRASRRWRKTIIELIVANGVMAGLVMWMAGNTQMWLTAPALWRITHLILILIAGMASYIVMLWVMGLRLHHLRSPN